MSLFMSYPLLLDFEYGRLTVPDAVCCDNRSMFEVMSGIITNPPPIPTSDPKTPAAVPIPNALGIE